MDKIILKNYGTLSGAKIYVSTRKKCDMYDNGDRPRQWLRPADYGSHAEFIDACVELHKDEDAPELRFPFSEDVPLSLIDDTKVNPALFGLLAICADLEEDEREAFSRWCGNASERDLDDDPKDVKERFQRAYVGEFASIEDFAHDMLDQFGPGLPDFALAYFDWSKYARDLLATDYYKDGTFYFRHDCYF